MPSPCLLLALLLTICFSLATQLAVWQEQSLYKRPTRGSVLDILLGDSRRLFANHFFVKADVYLHGGYYPSIFDQAQPQERSHLATTAEDPRHSTERPASDGTEAKPGDEEHDAATGFLGEPKDWIDAFGRNFFPTRHVHLENAEQREILPWLRLAAELNPNEVETYTVAAYWLRQRMAKVKEADQFLHEGWRANPDSYEILFELGRLYEENYKDDFRARNLYEAALHKWEATPATKAKPDALAFVQITGRLARLEEREGHIDRAIHYLQSLRKVSPSPDAIQAQIDTLKTKRQSR